MIESGSYRTVYEVEIDLKESSKGGLGGSGEVISSNTISRGDIDGEKEGDEVSFDIEFERWAELSGAMSFDGSVDGVEIDGGCELNNLTGSFDLELEQ